MVLDCEQGAGGRRGRERDRVHDRVHVDEVRPHAPQERGEVDGCARARLQARHLVTDRPQLFRRRLVAAGGDVDVVPARGLGPDDREQVPRGPATVGEPVGQVQEPHVADYPTVRGGRGSGVPFGGCPA